MSLKMYSLTGSSGDRIRIARELLEVMEEKCKFVIEEEYLTKYPDSDDLKFLFCSMLAVSGTISPKTLKERYEYLLRNIRDELSIDLPYYFKLLPHAYKSILKQKICHN